MSDSDSSDNDVEELERYEKMLFETMAKITGGFPYIVHQLPYSIFQEDRNKFNTYLGEFVNEFSELKVKLEIMEITREYGFKTYYDKKEVRFEVISTFERILIILGFKLALSKCVPKCKFDTIFINNLLDSISDVESSYKVVKKLHDVFKVVYIRTTRKDVDQKFKSVENVQIVTDIEEGIANSRMQCMCYW